MLSIEHVLGPGGGEGEFWVSCIDFVVGTQSCQSVIKTFCLFLSKTFANNALQTEEWIFSVVTYISYPGGKLGLFTKNVLGLEISAYGHHVQCQFLT